MMMDSNAHRPQTHNSNDSFTSNLNAKTRQVLERICWACLQDDFCLSFAYCNEGNVHTHFVNPDMRHVPLQCKQWNLPKMSLWPTLPLGGYGVTQNTDLFSFFVFSFSASVRGCFPVGKSLPGLRGKQLQQRQDCQFQPQGRSPVKVRTPFPLWMINPYYVKVLTSAVLRVS